MSKFLVLFAILVASTTAPAVGADGSTNCYHLRCDTTPVQIQVLKVVDP
jgi:hypothetical protein